VALLILLIMCTFAVLGQTPRPKIAEELWTRKLVVTDEAGTFRAILSVPRGGQPRDGAGLTFFDKEGKNCLVLAATQEGPTLILNDATGTSRMSLAVNKEGPRQFLFGEAGHGGTVGMAARTDLTGFVCTNADGKAIWQAP
jgi:hypothetical protein